ncbi:hypothetical protein F5Y18DRAFT_357146 [Xylariaceae sp. FL1019]|nr:hypothetical protein F5Y18DRAFT_357146 [Xylariaceae sp. FL1019]
MTAPMVTANERLLDLSFNVLSSSEELQRGRKRRRDLLEANNIRTQIPSTDSATFRGRCRYRSTSRYLDMSISRPTSQRRLQRGSHRNKSTSLSPSRRKLLRVMQLTSNHQRSQAPSRSRSPYNMYMSMDRKLETTKRRHQRTRSRSRTHTHASLGPEFGPHHSGKGTCTLSTGIALVITPLTSDRHCHLDDKSTIAQNYERR